MYENVDFEIKPIMNRVTSTKYLNDMILAGLRYGYKNIKIIIEENSRTYANICAPVAGVIDYYKKEGINFKIVHESSQMDYIKHSSFECPLIVEDCINTIALSYPLDKVWRFNTSEGINALVNAYIDYIRKTDLLGDGVLMSIVWCLYETMDNVLQHAESEYGFIMGQLQQESKRLSFCIFDYGRGIFNSLKNSKYHPLKPLDAITLALQEKVTRDQNIGQGNGMWGLSQIINENNGRMRISSSGAVYYLVNGRLRTIANGDFNLGRELGTTLVDFQLDYSKTIDIVAALKGYKPLDMWLENIEDDHGNYEIKVSEMSSGTGTRQAAKKLRILIINIIKETRKKIILDFNGVNLISSSFADELIGKIIGEYGFMFFLQTISIIGVSNINISVINRSIEQRMAQVYFDHKIEDDIDADESYKSIDVS